MNMLTIPKNFVSNDDLVIIPRKQYESFLDIGEQWKKRLFEEQDTDESVAIYKKEKKQGKLKILKSFSRSLRFKCVKPFRFFALLIMPDILYQALHFIVELCDSPATIVDAFL